MSKEQLHNTLLTDPVYGSSGSGEEFEQRRYLPLDTRIVADARKAELTPGTVKKYGGNPLFGEDKPWEKQYEETGAPSRTR
jgi:hypothetical protein